MGIVQEWMHLFSSLSITSRELESRPNQHELGLSTWVKPAGEARPCSMGRSGRVRGPSLGPFHLCPFPHLCSFSSFAFQFLGGFAHEKVRDLGRRVLTRRFMNCSRGPCKQFWIRSAFSPKVRPMPLSRGSIPSIS